VVFYFPVFIFTIRMGNRLHYPLKTELGMQTRRGENWNHIQRFYIELMPFQAFIVAGFIEQGE